LSGKPTKLELGYLREGRASWAEDCFRAEKLAKI